MANWRRRSVLSTGAALATGSILASVGTAGADTTTATVEGATPGDENGWSSFRGNAGNTAAVPGEGAFPAPETIAWTYDEAGDLAAADGTVYLRAGSSVHALDDADGSVRWTTDGIDAAGTPAVDGDTVYVGGGQLTALDAERGDPQWTTTLEGESTAPTVAGGVVYLVADGELLAIDATDGEPIWQREEVVLERTDADAAADVDDVDVEFAALPVAVANGTVYAAVGEGTGHDGTAGFAALDAATGETRWTYWEQWRWDPHGYVMATEDRVYTGSIGDGETYPVLDAETGAELERLTFRFPPAMTDATRVTTGRHGFSTAGHGEPERWSEGGGTDAWRRPVIVGETVIVPYYPGDESVNALYGFDLEDGTEQWTFTHADVDIGDLSDWYAASEDTVYVSVSDEGSERLVAIRSGDGAADDGDGDENEDPEDDDESGEDETSDDDPDSEDAEEDLDDGTEEQSDDDADPGEDAGDDTETDETDDAGSEPETTDSESDEGNPEPDETGADDGDPNDDAEDGSVEEGSEPGDGTDSSSDDPSDGSGDNTVDETADDRGDIDADGSGDSDPNDGASSTGDNTVDDDDSSDGYAGEEAAGESDANASTDDANGTDEMNGTDDDGGTGSSGDDSSDDTRDADENSSATGQDDETTETDDADGTPGFTTGVGIVSGALGLEWLRRRASVDEDVAE